ncbi:hypothetical protein N5P37_010898 [Trichoderma harzianum]|uniref:Uncharacterized protein n=1 Tax=Trichoderma harzianum CBS 226.95 TaxID=983964 RepID=A0A2T3ZZ67_TRIHA|nr:hypothetical protein M431DRAFT_499486 [Trichoderma harzianum CBS 226.95]KAK0756742.1 hypothetical protein N5P37_010898 [Trichoderma harzianum]PKK41308.1 hypothetical protein CI102_14673 [Trichoderma harzianum]PTB50033.1 hypothetical protein M431DRAFT_499486 [Trichoderma harzianum CBS 226.95]
MSRPLQHYVFPQPMMMPMSVPQFVALQQQQHVQPVVALSAMMIMPPPVTVMPMSFPLTMSILPPGAPRATLIPSSRGFKVVYFGYAPTESRQPWCAIHASWVNIVPSRDGLLAAIASWTGLHGLAIRHARGRIDAAKVKLYVMPRDSSGRDGGLYGLQIVSGEGLVLPADVVKVVTLDVDESVWEEVVRDVRREGYEALVVVDMSVSAPDGGGDGDATPAPDTATSTG